MTGVGSVMTNCIVGRRRYVGVLVAIEPEAPQCFTGWLFTVPSSSLGVCPCWVKMTGSSNNLNIEISLLMWGVASVTMDTNWFCMSTTRGGGYHSEKYMASLLDKAAGLCEYRHS